MNNKGNLLIIIVLAMLAAIFILPVLMHFFLPLNIIVRIILIFVIITSVRQFLGNSVISLLISGILIYFLVLKWWWVSASGWVFITLLGIGFFSIIVWGLGTTMKPKG